MKTHFQGDKKGYKELGFRPSPEKLPENDLTSLPPLKTFMKQLLHPYTSPKLEGSLLFLWWMTECVVRLQQYSTKFVT